MVSLDDLASAFGFDVKSDADWSTLGKVTAVNNDGTISVMLGGESTPTACVAYCVAEAGDIVYVIVSHGKARAIARQGGNGAASATLPAMDGTADVGTEAVFSRGDHVHPTDTSRAPLTSPVFTGIPEAPTAAAMTDTEQIATTSFVRTAIAWQKVVETKGNAASPAIDLSGFAEVMVVADITRNSAHHFMTVNIPKLAIGNSEAEYKLGGYVGSSVNAASGGAWCSLSNTSFKGVNAYINGTQFISSSQVTWTLYAR